ncbi:hypothetical protein L195_g012953 [Trifolium pratense]|uniref:Uncharacterized protein n=1 Tax=Trifolium pratense TaxID=57577 RepID=A0A2K3PLS2_TRIPR|nr:hypothetical protein L195_g012953 [Trifolium pratense]
MEKSWLKIEAWSLEKDPLGGIYATLRECDVMIVSRGRVTTRYVTASGVVPLKLSVKRRRLYTCSHSDAQVSFGVEYRFSLRMNTYLVNAWEGCIYSFRANALDGINGHQVAVEKRRKSHDEQLMLIIPVNGCYNASSIETV